MRVGVRVDTAALSLVPTQNHEVKLAVTLVDQVPGVSVQGERGGGRGDTELD